MLRQDVLCGRCKVGPQAVGNDESDPVYKCPVCGRTDRFPVIQNEVAEYAADYIARKFEADPFRGGDPGVNAPPEREYRWIVAGDL